MQAREPPNREAFCLSFHHQSTGHERAKHTASLSKRKKIHMQTQARVKTLAEGVPSAIIVQATILVLILVQLLVIQGLPGVGR